MRLNQDKTELVVISSKFRHSPDLEHIRVGDEYIAPKSSALNPGVIMDNCLCMDLEQHVKKICNEANSHLRNIKDSRISHSGLCGNSRSRFYWFQARLSQLNSVWYSEKINL